MESLERAGQSGNLSEKDQEARKIRRLQVMMGMVMSVISQDPSLTVEEASELAAGGKPLHQTRQQNRNRRQNADRRIGWHHRDGQRSQQPDIN